MDFASLYIDRGLNFDFLVRRKNIFIIHGHDELNLEKLQNLLFKFNLIPLTMGEYQTFSSITIIEKFEKLSAKCKYAIALCTPDDLIQKDDKQFYQPRPNVLYEIGWFCGKFGRNKVMILVKEGTEIFSDFQGVLQVRFKSTVKECYSDLHLALKSQHLLR